MTSPDRDPFVLLADRLAAAQTSTMALATVVGATPTHATVDLLGAVVTAPRLGGPTPAAGDVVLVQRQGAMIVVVGAVGGAAAPAGDANLSVTADQVAVLSAPKWTTPRTLSLTGDVTGSAALDGSANASIATTFTGGTNLAKHWAGDVPAGTACLITHSLGTRDVVVEVYSNSSPWGTVLCDVERTSTTQATLRFATAVGAGQFRAVVTGR
jgi:hypothetical protein